MTSLSLAKAQLDACARHFNGTWYLFATWTGYSRTQNPNEAGELVYTVTTTTTTNWPLTATEIAEEDIARWNAITRAIRRLYPHARRTAPVGIVRNGSEVRVVECIVCGQSASCCNRYPETKTVREFRAEHNAACGATLIGQDDYGTSAAPDEY